MSDLCFGAVAVIAGRYKGKVGYYDNDDTTEGGLDRAVVYFGEPFASNYYLIDHKYLRNVTSLDHEKFKKESPNICQQLGIV